MRRSAAMFGAVVLVAVPLLAAEFWEKKPFTQWSRDEVRRMLTRSPWAQQTTIPLDGPGPGFGPAGGLEIPQTGGPGGAGPGGVPDVAAGGPSGQASGEPFGRPSASVVVRWQSALPIKQALVQSRFAGETLSEAAQRFLEPDSDYYVVTAGVLPGMAVRALRDGPRLAAAAALKRKGRPALRADKAEISEAQDGSVTLFFYFCRSNAITAEDREVEFSLDLPDTRIARKFKLKDMFFAGKLEL